MEILFRGKRVDNNEWIDGFYAKSGDKTFILIDNSFAVGYVTMKEVTQESIGQYTGLTDKNGVQMCVGDIVKALCSFGMDIPSVIAFENGSFGLKWKRGDVWMFDAFTSICNTIYEVLGNIIDNPELMEARNGI